ncbi:MULTISPECIES: hypothetical protein [Pasteurellaceae]|uniref:Uncharacterized protein n=1 Tax=Mannheimia succiniciproducens (strain KCTC 0769BP / MBEL55E) TaxID=221988 RepID=Q65QZ0_MANSM|nr:hypothetical protein [[Mannheimia] succiniciproducens]AAU38620.1 unknown [[Mannheimia] succiniciproducens MBEL55E]
MGTLETTVKNRSMKITKIRPQKRNSCSICGKAQVTRKFQEEYYCANCYAQWFKKKTCKQCGQLKRIHREGELCLECEKLTDCVRCGKTSGTFEIGMISRYGAVCSSCTRYFREEIECSECGKMTRDRYRSLVTNESVCLQCYRRYTFATCKNCRRYRKVHNQEKQLCKKCDEKLLSTCSKCKGEMPSGYGNVCPDCARRSLLFNMIRLNGHILRNKAVKTAYKKFIFWYMRKCGISVVLHKGSDFMRFFIDCDDIWQKIPDYAELVTHFKPNGLRANLTVLRWLLDTNQVVVDEALKDDLAEMQRIQSLFNKLKESIPCIASYYKLLQRRYDDGKTSLKSVRLALQPAIDLISSQAVTDYPTQEQLNNYLSEKTGQIAAITGFINHLKSAYRRELKIDRKLIQQMKAKQLKKHYSKRLVELYKQTELTTAEQMDLLSVVLYSLHGIEIKKPKFDAIVLIDGVAYYRDNTKDYFLPQDIYLRIKPQF